MAVLVDALFVEGVADALGDAAFDLAAGEDGVEDAADFLEGVEAGDRGLVGVEVYGDFGDVDGPGVAGVGVAAVEVVVPVDLGGGFVAGGCSEMAVLCEVGLRGGDELLAGVGCGEVSAWSRRVARIWLAARSTSLPTIMAVRLATVGPELGTRAVSGWCDEDVVVGEVRGFRRRPGRGWCWCPGRTRWRRRGFGGGRRGGCRGGRGS